MAAIGSLGSICLVALRSTRRLRLVLAAAHGSLAGSPRSGGHQQDGCILRRDRLRHPRCGCALAGASHADRLGGLLGRGHQGRDAWRGRPPRRSTRPASASRACAARPSRPSAGRSRAWTRPSSGFLPLAVKRWIETAATATRESDQQGDRQQPLLRHRAALPFGDVGDAGLARQRCDRVAVVAGVGFGTIGRLTRVSHGVAPLSHRDAQSASASALRTRCTPGTVVPSPGGTPSRSKASFQTPDHGRAGAQHQPAADAVDHQQVVFHAGVDQRLAAVAEHMEHGRHLAVAREAQVGEAAVVEDQRRHDVLASRCLRRSSSCVFITCGLACRRSATTSCGDGGGGTAGSGEQRRGVAQREARRGGRCAQPVP